MKLPGSQRTVVCLIVVAIACGGEEAAGPAPSSTADIVGTYSGTWLNRATVSATGQETEVSCPGSVIVSDQDANGRFMGSWTQVGDSDCVAAAGTLAGGVAPGGALSISDFTNNTGESLEEATNGFCTSPDGSVFAGTADGSRFDLSRTAVAACQGTEITFTWELAARR